MTAIPVADPQGDSVTKLTSVFQDKTLIAGLVRALTKPSKIFQDIMAQMLTQRSLTTAAGAQLDGIGSIVGELRMGRDDFEYRRGIILRIAINTSKGTPEDAIAVFSLITDSTEIQYVEFYPGHVGLATNSQFQYGYTFLSADSFAFDGGVDGLGYGDLFDPSIGGVFVGLVILDVAGLYALMQRVLPAGVELDYLAYFEDPAFSFDGDPYGLGFGDYYDGSIGGGFATIIEP